MRVWVFLRVRKKPAGFEQRAVFRVNPLFGLLWSVRGVPFLLPTFGPVRAGSIAQPTFPQCWDAPLTLLPIAGAWPACAGKQRAARLSVLKDRPGARFPGSLQVHAPRCIPGTSLQAQNSPAASGARPCL